MKINQLAGTWKLEKIFFVLYGIFLLMCAADIVPARATEETAVITQAGTSPEEILKQQKDTGETETAPAAEKCATTGGLPADGNWYFPSASESAPATETEAFSNEKDRKLRETVPPDLQYDTGPRSDIEGIEKFAHVSNALYRGAQPSRKGFEFLRKKGVRTVVNLRTMHSDRPLIKGLGFKYIHISFKAFHPEDEDVIRFIRVISNRDNWPVFVHCQQGVDRTGMMVAIYRMYFEGWSAEKAIEEMRKFGFHEVWVQIEKYLERLDLGKLRKMVDDAREPELDTVE